MPAYKVLIDDNFHFMGESERITHGLFVTAAEAIAACEKIVDDCLEPMLGPGMTATALYEQYESFGDDPFIMPVDPDAAPVAFSAWAYAKQRREAISRIATGYLSGKVVQRKLSLLCGHRLNAL